MNPLYNLAAKALSVVIVPAVIGTSLIIPKHYNLATYPQGTYQEYKYKAKVMQHPDMNGFQAGRVMEIVVTEKGQVVAKLTEKGWEILNSDDKQNVLNIIKELEKEMAEEHHHGWAGI